MKDKIIKRQKHLYYTLNPERISELKRKLLLKLKYDDSVIDRSVVFKNDNILYRTKDKKGNQTLIRAVFKSDKDPVETRCYYVFYDESYEKNL